MVEDWKLLGHWKKKSYYISNTGLIKSISTKSEIILRPRPNQNGYLRVCLPISMDGTQKDFYIHRLVATNFIDNPNLFKEVNHKDFNRANNVCSNLEWTDRTGNVRHSVRAGRMSGDNHWQRKRKLKCD